MEEGLKQLKKADQYQKKNRKMHCIVILAVIVIILLFVLIVTKTWYITEKYIASIPIQTWGGI